MPRTKVLVVDDAVVVRRIVTDALSADPSLEIVGTAPNGRIALSKIPQVNPDIVTLDIEMPEMDGIETLKEIRKAYPRLPVIMFSTLTERGAAITMEALLGGANDYVTKPANVGSVQEAMQAVRAQLVPKIHALCGTVAPNLGTGPRPAFRPNGASSGQRKPVTPQRPAGPAPRIDAVVLGVSTGGPNALAELIPAIPADLPVPILVVQHMPPMFTRLLAERLNAHSRLRITEAVAGDVVMPGRILIAPGDHHMELERRGTTVRVVLGQGPPENSCRPSVDVLFRSASTTYGAHTLGVVLTGMGADGRSGSELVHEAGGRIIAQDEASSVVWGMPGAVVEAGVADEILPLGAIANAIRARVAAAARPQEVRG